MTRKTLTIALICLFSLAFAGISHAESCDDLAGASVTVFSDSPGLGCKMVTGGNITGMSWLAADALFAVDIWGWNQLDAEVCFTGFGSIRFADATTSPRAEVALAHVTRNNVTCARIGHAGTAMLMPEQTMGMTQVDPDPQLSLDGFNSVIPLSGCMLSTTPYYNVKFRATPGGDDIGRVKYGTAKEAMARTPNWFKVLHDGVEGWISAHWVEMEGNCG